MPPRTLVIVSHTHWDREWYLPFERYRLRLVGMMDTLLDLFDRDPNYKHFMLDGHTAVLEDYLEARPERRADVARHARAGRLLLGPWYVIPDEFLPGGEALVRNILRGLTVARRFGEPMMVGYIPDPFGQIAHMPAILRGFGIKRAMMWRGADASLAKTEFFWRAPDGSEILTVHMAQGYGIAERLPAGKKALGERLQSILAELEPRATTPYLLLMNGSDHLPPQTDLSRIIASARRLLPDYEVVHGNPPLLFDGVEASMDGKAGAWPRFKGEFRSGQRANVLPGVLSARMWIKQRNQACEDLLTRWAEPLSTWAALLGRRLGEKWRPPVLPPGPGSPYPDDPASIAGVLAVAWRYLLHNQPHDSICGCSVDQVHDEMRPRYDRCDQIGEEITRQAMRAIATQVGGAEDGAIVFNSEAGPRDDFVSLDLPLRGGEAPVAMVDAKGQASPCQVIGRTGDRAVVGFVARGVPGYGYRAFRARYRERQRPPKTAGVIENEFFHVQASARDGSLTVVEKASGRRLTGLNRFVDGGDRGDEYNYCPPERDTLVDKPARAPRVRVIEAGPARSTLEVALVYSLPRSLEAHRRRRSAGRVACRITTRVSLYPGIRRIDVSTTIDNASEDHRLRVHFPAGVQTDVSHAEQHFGVVTRSIALPEHDETWGEPPTGTYPQKSFVDVNDGKAGLMVANRGLPEYEALPGRNGVTIALTLLRCVGFLSRGDLTTRRHHAGPPLETPGAQMKGRHTFEYAIIPHGRGWQTAYQEAHRFARPLRARRLAAGPRSLPGSGALLEMDDPAFVVMAVKRAEDGGGVIVRLYNTLSRRAAGSLRLTEPLRGRAVERSSLDERTLETLPVERGRVRFTARPNEIITLRFRTAPL